MPEPLVSLGGLLAVGKALLDFATGTKKNSEEIKKLREEMSQFSKENLRLALELRHQKQQSADERRLIALELRNILLEHGIKPPNSFPALPSPLETAKDDEDEDDDAL